MTVQQAFQLALQHHQAGRLTEAEAIYRQILATQPRHSDALQLLGVIAHQVGRHDLALDCLRQAIACDPNNAAAHSNLGFVCRALNRPEEAIAACRMAVKINPNYPDALNNLGNALKDMGQLDEAIDAYRQAIALQPNSPEAYCNLGDALQDRGKPEEAIAACRQAITLQPNLAEAHNNLGAILMEKGQLEEAITAVRRALELKPDHAGTYYNLGVILRLQGQRDEAIAAYRRALALKPDDARVHDELGVVLAESGRLDDAAASCRRALELDPNCVKACNNLGHLLTDLGQFDAAFAMFHQALQLQPNFADARFGEAMLRLLQGDFEHGWPLYEVRWEAYRSEKRDFAQPMWDGGGIDGRRLLIHAEQGSGDSIQFIRYANLAAARGADVMVECSRHLVELFRSVKGVVEVFSKGDPLPPFDLHIPMLSQPLVFKTSRESIPREVPYLFAESRRRSGWEGRLGIDRTRVRVGLAWAGSPQHRRNRIRNISVDALRPLLRTAEIEFYSLQLGGGSEQLRQFPDVAGVIDHTEQIEDFADTAAFMMELDLIISVDTAVAHLAGALGRPVWTLLPFVPDWRWGLKGETTPWYPTMRLFRQPSPGDWDSVVAKVREELQLLI